MTNPWWCRNSVILALLASAGAAPAQTIRGVVTESQSSRPVAGAVVMLMDSAGQVLTRTVTSEQGAYTVSRPAEAVRGRVLRLGFRPHDISREEIAALGPGALLMISIIAIPQMLEPVVARAGASCPKRKDREAAFGFWEQAKAGLMASVYASAGNPGMFSTLTYEKYLAHNTDSVVIQRVRADSGMWTRTFSAVFTAQDFVDVGFVRLGEDLHYTFYGPDAEVLLENNFQSRYCFSLAARDPKRPTQVGLHFSPVKVKALRVDIDGNFWIDTAARQLRDIEYKYVGISGGADRYTPGGLVTFRELANGVPFVDTWSIRMVSQVNPAKSTEKPSHMPGYFGAPLLTAHQFDVTVGGGVLAHARWPDGTRYDAPLGTARIHAIRDDATPVTGLRIDLDSTFYGGVTDSAGNLVLTDLLPGPYSTILIDTTLDAIGLKLRSSLDFVALPDTTVETMLFVHEAAAALAHLCGDMKYDGYAVFVARVATPDNKPIAGVHWTLGDKFGTTTANGVITPCIKFSIPGRSELEVWRDRGFPSPDQPFVEPIAIRAMVTVRRIELRFPEDSKTPPPLPPSKP